MNPKLSSAWRWSRHYLAISIPVLAVFAYINVTGDNTVFDTTDYDRRIDSLERVLANERDTMLFYEQLNSRLSTEPELMEQVVREQYGMKRAGEDVFLTIEPQER